MKWLLCLFLGHKFYLFEDYCCICRDCSRCNRKFKVLIDLTNIKYFTEINSAIQQGYQTDESTI